MDQVDIAKGWLLQDQILKLIVICFLALIFTMGCAGSIGPNRPTGDFVLSFNTDASTAEVLITGTDMSAPISADVEIRDGIALGVFEGVEAGPNRRVWITTHDESGRRCTAIADVNVEADSMTSIDSVSFQCPVDTDRTAMRNAELTAHRDVL